MEKQARFGTGLAATSLFSLVLFVMTTDKKPTER
jgi:hypothetical protein